MAENKRSVEHFENDSTEQLLETFKRVKREINRRKAPHGVTLILTECRVGGQSTQVVNLDTDQLNILDFEEIRRANFYILPDHTNHDAIRSIFNKIFNRDAGQPESKIEVKYPANTYLLVNILYTEKKTV